LLAATVAGSVAALVVPLAYSALFVLAGAGAAWALPLRPIHNRPALAAAIAVLLVGLIASGGYGLREEAGETG
jgi:hypothetical protein